jgi:hypothetical protein
MPQNNCTPQSVYGGWNQTLFLGLTVRDFSAQAGWGQQGSTLTVNLVYDNCSGTRQYFDEQFNWTSGEFNGDPGYNNPTIGSAAIFKIAESRTGEFDVENDGFEFAGILQSYNNTIDGNGQNVTTVSIVTPTLLLDGTQVIIDGFSEELPHRAIFNDEYVNNVINAYGYLESLGGDCADYLDPSTGAGLGSPAGGFGNAQRSERGVPWIWIKNAMQVLLGGQYNGNGTRSFSNLPGVAKLIKGVGTYGSVYSNEYIVDIADLPGSNELNNDLSANPGGGSQLSKAEEPETALDSLQYRLNGPIMTVSDVINQVTNDAGYDYFVDLYPTKNDFFESGVVNVIKVRTVPRFNYYSSDVLTDIQNFATANADYITSDTLGKELILDNTEALLIGAQRRDMFQVYPEDTGIQGAYSRIQPFFGYQPGTVPVIDGSGVVEREPVEVLWGQDPGLMFESINPFERCSKSITEDFLQQWFFKLDYNKLPLNYVYNLDTSYYDGDPESLLCMAKGDFQSWVQWLFRYGGPPENKQEQTCRLYSAIVDKAEEFRKPGQKSFYDWTDKDKKDAVWWWAGLDAYSANNRVKLKYNSKATPGNVFSETQWIWEDLNTIYKFLNEVTETYYGKQFLVEVPFACRSLDPITNKWNYSDVPSTDGGYVDVCTTSAGQQIPNPGSAADDPDVDFDDGDDCLIGVTGIIGLKHPLETDIFSDDVGKLPALLKFDPYIGYGLYHDRFQRYINERDDNGDLKGNQPRYRGAPNFIDADFPQDEFYTLGGGFDTALDFDPFKPVYVKCEVEESWIVINKPIYESGSRCTYFQGDDNRASYDNGGGVSLNAIVKLPQEVTLAPNVRENPNPTKPANPIPSDKYISDAPYYGLHPSFVGNLGNNFRLAQNYETFIPNNQDNDAPPFLDPDDLRRYNLPAGDEVAMGSFPFAFPCNAVLPLKSNTRTYGPFYRYSVTSEDINTIAKGIPGKTFTEKDEGLAPWEYGGTVYMNEGANAKLSGIVRRQQQVERGSLTVAGYPNLQMGSALDERPYYINNRYGNGTPRSLTTKFYSSPTGPQQFFQLDTIPATTGNKSQITDVSTQVSPTNVTTSYTLSTFTPVNGRFNRDNADRLKQQAQERYKRDREIRASKRQTANAELSLAKKRFRNLGLQINTTSFVERSSPMAFAGVYQDKNASPTGNLSPPGQVNTVTNSVSGIARKEVFGQSTNQISQLSAYDDAGLMSMDGFFRPVRTRASLNSGLGSQLSVENDAADILGDAYQTVPYRSGPYQKQVRQSETPPGPLNDWTGLIINTTYLDFLVGPYTQLSARSSNSGVGHDIEIVARENAEVIGNENFGNLSVLNSGNEIQHSTTDTYRYMAHRGPLVIAGWGYDLYGKPIPNANETGLFSGIPGQTQLPQNEWTSGSAYSGLHRQDYNLLTDEFHSGFLSDPETWPVGPVDLRWDRKRSVWTVPNDFRIYVANLQDGLSGLGDTAVAAVSNADDVYDATGNRPVDWEIVVTMPLPDVAIDAEPILVYYSHESGQWWPLSYCCASQGGGGGGGGGSGGGDPPPCRSCGGDCWWQCVNNTWVKNGNSNCYDVATNEEGDCGCAPPSYNCVGTSDIFVSTACQDTNCVGGSDGGGTSADGGGGSGPIVYTSRESSDTQASQVYGEVIQDMYFYDDFTYGNSINPLYVNYTGYLADVTGTGYTSFFITDCIGTGNNYECFNRDLFDSGAYSNFCISNPNNTYALPSGTKVDTQFDASFQCYKIRSYKLPNNGCKEVTASESLYFYPKVMADASAGQIILDLPISTGTGIAGAEFYIKKIDSSTNTVIISGTESDLIDGQSTYTMNNQYEAIKVVNCGASTWYVL